MRRQMGRGGKEMYWIGGKGGGKPVSERKAIDRGKKTDKEERKTRYCQ